MHPATDAATSTTTRHVPHSDGFSAGIRGRAGKLTMAVFTCEYTGERPDFVDRARRLAGDDAGPAAIHVGEGTRTDGRRFDLVIGYWLDRQRYDRWQQAHPWPQWCAADAAAARRCGLSREVFSVPVERLETLLSAADIRHGLAGCGLPVVGPVMQHGYWGSMRDRIERPDPVAAPLRASMPVPPAAVADYGDWGRAAVVRPTAGLCLICSGQDWSACEPEHARFFAEQLRPRLTAAMSSLQRDARRHGCADVRTVELIDAGGRSRSAGFVLAWFGRLDDLERWARTDPEHLEIFGAFIAHKRATRTALRLWHEVLLLPGGDQARFEYLRCSPPAGLAAAPS